MELRQAILADYFELEPTGRFYVGGGFSQVVNESYPASLGDKLLVIIVDSDVGEPEVGVTVAIRYITVEEPLASVPFDLGPRSDAEAGTPMGRHLRINLKDIVLPVQGIYYFDIYLGDQLRQSLRFVALRNSDFKGSA